MDKKIHIFSIVMSAFVFFISILGDAHAEEPLSLAGAVAEALESNPEILASRRSYEASRTKVPQELFPEDPMLEYSYDEIRAGVPDLMGKPMRSYAIEQRMPFPTKLYLKSSIAAKDAKIMYEAYKEKEREIVARTKSAYIDLWLLEKSIAIAGESEMLLEQFSTSAASRFSVGKASQQDALKAQVELAKVKNEVIVFEQRRTIAQAQLNALLNRDGASAITIDKELKKGGAAESLEELINLAKETRPRLKAFKYAIEKGKTIYMLAWNEFLPDLSGRYEQMIVDGSGDKWAGTLGISVPVWLWAKQGPGVGQRKNELDMAKAEYRTMENMVVFEVKDAHARIGSYKKLVSLYETSFMPQAEQTLKASLTGYEANQIDFLNLLDSQRMLLEIKLDYQRMVADLEVAKAELEKAVGVDIYE